MKFTSLAAGSHSAAVKAMIKYYSVTVDWSGVPFPVEIRMVDDAAQQGLGLKNLGGDREGITQP